MIRLAEILILLSAAALVGCGTAAKVIGEGTLNGKAGVFTEVKNGGAPPEGFADLVVRAGIKTHPEGYYPFEPDDARHGKKTYPFLLTIDGQSAQWEVEGFTDIRPAYNADGTTSRDPEAREGMKYLLDKKVRLATGMHTVVLGLPADDYSIGVSILVTDAMTSVLEFRPVYRTKNNPVRIPTFLKGIDRYEVFLNDRRVN